MEARGKFSNSVGSEIEERDCERVEMGDKTQGLQITLARPTEGFVVSCQSCQGGIGGESFVGHLRGENWRLNWGMHSEMRNIGDDWNGRALWPGL